MAVTEKGSKKKGSRKKARVTSTPKVAFGVSYKDRLRSESGFLPEKFTLDPPLPLVDSSQPWAIDLDYSRGGGYTWDSIEVRDFRTVEPGVSEIDPILTREAGGGIARAVFGAFPRIAWSLVRTGVRFVAFTVVFTSTEPEKVVIIDPIFIDDPGNPG